VQNVQNFDVKSEKIKARQIMRYFNLCSEPFLMLGNLCIPVGLTT